MGVLARITNPKVATVAAHIFSGPNVTAAAIRTTRATIEAQNLGRRQAPAGADRYVGREGEDGRDVAASGPRDTRKVARRRSRDPRDGVPEEISLFSRLNRNGDVSLEDPKPLDAGEVALIFKDATRREGLMILRLRGFRDTRLELGRRTSSPRAARQACSFNKPATGPHWQCRHSTCASRGAANRRRFS